MQRLKRSVPGVFATLVLLLAPLQAALAAVDVADLAFVDCYGITRDADCAITLAPGLRLLAPRADLLLHPDGRGFDLVGDAEIPTGSDPIALAEASLTIRVDASGTRIDQLVGVALMPMPNGGFLGPVEVTERPYAAVGYASGLELLSLEGPIAEAPLRLDRNYFFFDAVARFAAELPPISMQTPGGAGVVVLDPTDPFFYVAGEVQGFGGDGKKKQDSDASGNTSTAANGSSSSGGGNAGNAGSASNASEDSGSGGDDAAGIAGFAFSVNGLIPFVPDLVAGVEGDMPVFDGHFFQRTSAPLSPLPIQATGEFVYDLDPDQDGDTPFTPEAFASSPDLAYGINGSLEVGIPFLRFFRFGFPLGEASASVLVGQDDMRAAFSGRVTADEFLPNLPIPIRPTGGIEVHGLLAVNDILDSYIHAEGEMGIDASFLGALSGVPLGELQSTDAVLDINVLGLSLRGSTSVGIHPSVQLEGESGFEVFISPDGDSRLTIFGNFIIGGERLENAELVVDAAGVHVAGRYRTGETVFEMAGEIRGDGYLLEGAVQLADPIEGNAQERVALLNAVLSNQRNVDALESSLAAANASVSALLPKVESSLAAVRSAQSTVDSLNASIRYQSSRASRYYSSYKSWKRKSCRWYDAKCRAKRAAKMSYYYGRYAYHVSVRAGLYGSRAAATAALSTATSYLNVVRGNLSNAQSLFQLAQAELASGIEALQAAQAKLDALPPIEGTLDMIATIGIENGGVRAGVEGLFNGQKLTEGHVNFGNPGEACILVPTVGFLCSPL